MENENKAVQQSFDLSWEESQHDLQVELSAKKLLLKKEVDKAEAPVENKPPTLILKRPEMGPELNTQETVDYSELNDSETSLEANLDQYEEENLNSQEEAALEEYEEEAAQEEYEEEALEEYEEEVAQEEHEEEVAQEELAEEAQEEYAEEEYAEEEHAEEAQEDHSEETQEEYAEEAQEEYAEEEHAEEEHAEEEHAEEEEEEEEEETSAQEDLQKEFSDENYSFNESQESTHSQLFNLNDSGTFTIENECQEETEPSEEENAEPSEEENAALEEDTALEEDAALEEGAALEGAPSKDIELQNDEDGTVKESIFQLKADTYYDQQLEEPLADEEAPVSSDLLETPEADSLGDILQMARLACNYSIKDAAESTRIKTSYIVALEQNDFSELPIRVYTMNYIRQLAREYNIAHEPLIEAYDSASNTKPQDKLLSRPGNEDASIADRPNSWLNSAIVFGSLAAFIILLLVAWSMKWLNPNSDLSTLPNVDIQLEELREPITLPSPELPVPFEKSSF